MPGYEGVIWSSGFLVPTKTKGRLEIFNMNAEDPTKTCINIASKDVITLLLLLSVVVSLTDD